MKKKKYKICFLILFIILTIIGFNEKNINEFIQYKKTQYSEFLKDVKKNNIKKVLLKGYNIYATTKKNKKITTLTTPLDKNLIKLLIDKRINFNIKNKDSKPFLIKILISWIPTLIITIMWMGFLLYLQKNKNGIFTFGKSKAKKINSEINKINFSNVGGCYEVKEELIEIVEFLKNPKKFKKLGAQIPRGVLMIGPTGTGKTLLAKAIAGEAKVPFFTTSGSDFVEIFVGVGASRVRSMFKNAKNNSPCIIFIDEIDAVGKKRSYNFNNSNDEREQTLNQLLVEMDGFQTNSEIIVIAATNRADVLDKALLRPGRFDRRIIIDLPDIKGRKEILNLYMKKIPISKNVKIDILARSTPGFSGADLKNLINEASLHAARLNKEFIEMQDFENAKDKIVLGPEKKSTFIRENDRINTAYHESGHTVVAKILPTADPVHKVTIIPRGHALGVTWQIPKYDKLNSYKNKILEEISILFAGRISEIMFMNHISTGATNDFQKATKLARDMVIKFGMSETLGVMNYENEEYTYQNSIIKNISEKTQQEIDLEIRKIINTQYEISKNILEKNREKVIKIAKKLLELETINSKQINDIMNEKI